MNWFKQIIEYKNAIMGKKEAPGYLQTIESEEILPNSIGQSHTAAYQSDDVNARAKIYNVVMCGVAFFFLFASFNTAVSLQSTVLRYCIFLSAYFDSV